MVSFFSKISSALLLLNEKIGIIANRVKKISGINFDPLPKIFNSSFGFLLSILTFYFAIGSINNLAFNLISIGYPVFYSLYLLNNQSYQTHFLVPLNQYWLLLGGIILLESFGILPFIIPGYGYLKLFIILQLIRYDFNSTSRIVNLILPYYHKLMAINLPKMTRMYKISKIYSIPKLSDKYPNTEPNFDSNLELNNLVDNPETVDQVDIPETVDQVDIPETNDKVDNETDINSNHD